MRVSIATLATITSLALTTAAPAQEEPWALLASVRLEEHFNGQAWWVTKTFPDDLRAAADDFTLTGYYVPVLAEPYPQQFILVEDPADCPFCGSGGYGPALEVHLARPMAELPEFSRITLTGDLEFIEDPDTLQLYVLRGARVLAIGS